MVFEKGLFRRKCYYFHSFALAHLLLAQSYHHLLLSRK